MIAFCLGVLSLILTLQFGKLETIKEDLNELSRKHIMPIESKDREEL